MSNNKMLIDATHPEETRVVVLRGGRVEEFDYESAARKLLRGNIYLAKVTRVEPSLQAAFVDYGGNRHGFLAFNEIHPDYYQIPVADRRALLEEEAAAEAEEEAEAEARAERRRSRGNRNNRNGGRGGRRQDAGQSEAAEDNAVDVSDLLPPEPTAGGEESAGPAVDDLLAGDDRPVPAGAHAPDDAPGDDAGPREMAARAAGEATLVEPVTDLSDAPAPIGNVEDVGVHEVEPVESNGGEAEETVESVGSEDALEEVPSRVRRRPRSYKIQEVIKRRQVLLVQVVKEERGNKGAALTTYLSLAGRYTVLMPNTGRGGGISRKITNPQDRKFLKSIAQELEVPEGMGLIIRTAGASRSREEIKRDFEYLLRLWESVREVTLQSTAPQLVYEEGNLIKRSIRDLYTKEVEEIVVAGEPAFVEARDFMRMLMPSHAKNVIAYQSPEPLFSRYQIERQLNAMFSPYVHLRSGGYLVINQTEALVAIDINSGKSTREFSIEETALNTNLEAADEIARQLKLRDLAGLIVIDFIDMEEKRNNRAVERRLKDALRFDRARIQLGRISHFGLMEMSRQRMRTGVLEGSTTQCAHCQGTGTIRSTESVALAVLRGLEDHLMAGHPTSLVATTANEVALYILNNKRPFLTEMETRYGISISVLSSERVQGANFTIEKSHEPARLARRPDRAAVNMEWGFEDEEASAGEGEARESAPERVAQDRGRTGEDDIEGDGASRDEGAGEGGDGRRSRRRRRRRGRRGEPGEARGEHRHGGGEGHHRSGHDGDANGDGRAAFAGSEGDDPGLAPRGAGGDQPPFDSDEEPASGEPGQARTAGERDPDGGDDEERRGRRGRRRGRRGGRRRERGEGGADAGPEARAQDDQPDVEGDGGRDEPFGASPDPVEADRDPHPRAMDDDAAPAEAAPAREPRARRDERGERGERGPGRNGEGHGRGRNGHRGGGREPAPETAEARPAPSGEAGPSSAPSAFAPPQPAEPMIDVPPLPAAGPRHPRANPVATEPVIERVVVRPDETQPVVDASKPARKGWWSRKFGGGE